MKRNGFKWSNTYYSRRVINSKQRKLNKRRTRFNIISIVGTAPCFIRKMDEETRGYIRKVIEIKRR